MRRLPAPIVSVFLGLVFCAGRVEGVITRITPLKEVLATEKLIFVAKVDKIDADKPAIFLTVSENLKGKPLFRAIPVNLIGDREGQKEKHPAAMLKRLAPGIPLIVFTSLNKQGTRYTAFGFTEGTWFQMIGEVNNEDPALVRWSFTHCEPYLRRTFKGTTAELRQVLLLGLEGKNPPPEPNPNEPPGLGPEIKSAPPRKDKSTRYQMEYSESCVSGSAWAVIPTFTIVGPLALFAALFPAIFGGLMLVLKRWKILLAVAGLNSSLLILHGWFQRSISEYWWGKPVGLWIMLTAVTLLGAFWSWFRFAATPPEDRSAALVPQKGEKIVLAFLTLVGLLVVTYCRFRGILGCSPWRELLAVWLVAGVGSLYMIYLGSIRRRRPPALSAPIALPVESVMLWALVFACAGLAAITVPRDQLGIDVAWKFEPQDPGTIISSPLLTQDCIYVAGAFATSSTQTFGTVYCLDRSTGKKLWSFDNDGEMKQVSISSPCLADGRLYVGEGFHQDTDCRCYCIDARSGKKLWDFQTRSHVESSPCCAGDKVFFGAGDDGVYCLSAKSGERIWNFTGVHVDTTPAIHGNRLYAGSGHGQSHEAFCLDTKTGNPIWRKAVDMPVWGSPVVVGDRVFLGLGNGNFLHADAPNGSLVCFHALTGAIEWIFKVPGAVLMRPAVPPDGRCVYFGCRDHCVYCLSLPDGQLQWRVNLGSPVVTSPALSGTNLYVTASAGRVVCLLAETGAVRWDFDVRQYAQKTSQIFSSPVVSAGRVYFGAGLETLTGFMPILFCLEER
jgi:outer membrane protein assembly factor BamB